MMARTRKRDDDSQYNSDATSLAALDASSMSAAGSRSSLTFASSTKALKKKPRPTKRRKKSLTDALQSISLDKDKGVPQQILSASKCGGFPFSKSVAFSTIVTTGNASGNASPLMFGTVTGVPNFNALNSKQQASRQMDRATSGVDGDGDIYYDDDNSQLTTSSDEDENIVVVDGMEEGYHDDEDEDNDDDSLRKRLATMTDFEKAQRKIMLQLVFGKDHTDDSNKAKAGQKSNKLSSSPNSNARPSVRKAPAHRLPFSTISTTTETKRTKIETAMMAPIPLKATPLISDTDDEKAKNGDIKNPVDRKIEELLRRSLKNLREGSHPLRLSNSKNGNSDSSFSNPRKTQDDMAIDPQIYARQIQTQTLKTPREANHSMALENDNRSDDTAMKTTHSSKSQPETPQFRIKRSNSLPGGLDMTNPTNVAMDMDG